MNDEVAVRFLLAVAALSVAVSPASAQSCGDMTITDCIDYYWPTPTFGAGVWTTPCDPVFTLKYLRQSEHQ